MSSQAGSQVSASLSLAPAISQAHTTTTITTALTANDNTPEGVTTQRLIDPIDEVRRADVSFAAASLGEAVSPSELSCRSPHVSKTSLASLPIAISIAEVDGVDVDIDGQEAIPVQVKVELPEGEAQVQNYNNNTTVTAATASPQLSSYNSCVSLSAGQDQPRRAAHVVSLRTNKEDLRGMHAVKVSGLHAQPVVPHTTPLPTVVNSTLSENTVQVRLEQEADYRPAQAELLAQEMQKQTAAQQAKQQREWVPANVVVTRRAKSLTNTLTGVKGHAWPSHTAAEGAALRAPYYWPHIHDRDEQPRRPPVPHIHRLSPARLARFASAPATLHKTHTYCDNITASVQRLQRIHSVNARMLRQRSLGLYGNLPYEALIRSRAPTPMRLSTATSTTVPSRRGSVGSAPERRSMNSNHSHPPRRHSSSSILEVNNKQQRPFCSVPRMRSHTRSGTHYNDYDNDDSLHATPYRFASASRASREVWQRPPLPFARSRTTLLAPFSYTATAQERRQNSPFVSPARHGSATRRAATPLSTEATVLNVDYIRAVTTTTYCGVTGGRAVPQRTSPACMRAEQSVLQRGVGQVPPAPSLRGQGNRGRSLRSVTKPAPLLPLLLQHQHQHHSHTVDKAVQTESLGPEADNTKRTATPVVHKAPSFVHLRGASPVRLISTWTDVNYLHEPTQDRTTSPPVKHRTDNTATQRQQSVTSNHRCTTATATASSPSPKRAGRTATPQPRRTPRQHILRGSCPRHDTGANTTGAVSTTKPVNPTPSSVTRPVLPAVVVAVPRGTTTTTSSCSTTITTTRALPPPVVVNAGNTAKKAGNTAGGGGVVAVVASALSELRPLSELPHPTSSNLSGKQEESVTKGVSNKDDNGRSTTPCYHDMQEEGIAGVRTTAVYRESSTNGTTSQSAHTGNILSSERAWFAEEAVPTSAFHAAIPTENTNDTEEAEARMSELPLRPTLNDDNDASTSVTISRLSSQRATTSQPAGRLTSLSPPPPESATRATLVPAMAQSALPLNYTNTETTTTIVEEEERPRNVEAAMARMSDDVEVPEASNSRLAAALQRLSETHSPSPLALPPSHAQYAVETTAEDVTNAAPSSSPHSMSTAQRDRVRAMLSSAVRLQEAEGQTNAEDNVHASQSVHIALQETNERMDNEPNVTPQSATSAAFSSALDVSANETGNEYLCADAKRGYAWQVPTHSPHSSNSRSRHIVSPTQDGVL